MSNSAIANSHLVPNLPPALAAVLPDGFTTEVCPAANRWWREAGQWLRVGKLLTFDYGLTEEELLSPEKGQGTLRACYRHHLSSDVLAHPGEQDLTAHVNFSALLKTGESVGLSTRALMTQGQFLGRVFENASKRDVGLGGWTSKQSRQFQTLVHPNHFGSAFRVLVQERTAK